MPGTEYIFFDEVLRDRFVQYVAAQSIPVETRQDVMEGFIVELPDGFGDEVLDLIEAQYDALMDEQMVAAQSREDWVTHQAAGVTITLADGQSRLVRLPTDIARPLLEHFAPAQIQAFVQAIAQSIDNPVDGPLCHKV